MSRPKNDDERILSIVVALCCLAPLAIGLIVAVGALVWANRSSLWVWVGIIVFAVLIVGAVIRRRLIQQRHTGTRLVKGVTQDV